MIGIKQEYETTHEPSKSHTTITANIDISADKYFTISLKSAISLITEPRIFRDFF